MAVFRVTHKSLMDAAREDVEIAWSLSALGLSGTLRDESDRHSDGSLAG